MRASFHYKKTRSNPLKGTKIKSPHMLPQHRPHEQLRTEPPRQKDHSDKYVSAFVSGENHVDMSFRSPILPKSSDHFKVGVDEMTLNLSALSMLEFEPTGSETIFRVIRRGHSITIAAGAIVGTEQSVTGFQLHDGPAGNLDKWRNAFSFKVDRTYNTMLEFLERCSEIATAVGSYIREPQGLTQGAPPTWNFLWTPIANGVANNQEHFRIGLSQNGQLRFSGNRIFWSNFAIEVPMEKYRQIFFRNPDQRYMWINPITEQAEMNVFVETNNLPALPVVTTTTAVGWGCPNNYHVTAPGTPENTRELEFVTPGNILSSLDRRVTLEVGCSLPLKNSPMIDHGQEAPDFVLGRYMFHQPYTMKSFADAILTRNPAPELLIPGLGTRTMQGPQDRVCYHHLQAQQKIQILRIRLWARVRSYDTSTRKWGMKTIRCPMKDIDYWHLRLHFIEK